MFEDSTFESAGKIHTRSRGWMLAALAFNSSILLALILIPLLYPQALPRQAIAFLLPTPPPPLTPPPVVQLVRAALPALTSPFLAPRIIPAVTYVAQTPEPPSPIAWNPNATVPGTSNDPFAGQGSATVINPAPVSVRVSSSAEEALLIRETRPSYPPLGRAARVQGTVVLVATISKTGSIEDLRVSSGPPLLQQAALEAVKSWRYRPYLLDGQPVEVETAIRVVFSLDE